MINVKKLDPKLVQIYRLQTQARIEAERATRLSWWGHWGDLAEVYLPRRYKWFVTPNQYNRGSQINGTIIDETGMLAARTLAAGMMSGMTSPTKQWAKLGLHDLEKVEYGEVKTWLSECERRLFRVLAESNFYTSLAQFYHDLAVFGSASMIIYDDFEDVIRCFNPCLGEFFFSGSARLDINAHFREFTYTTKQSVEMFGIENVSPSTAQAYKTSSSRTQEVVIQHAIEPNTPLYDGEKMVGYLVPKRFKFREIYWEVTSSGTNICRAAGFSEKPFIAGRWDVTSNDPYGRSPGMDAYPATKQLQVEQRRKGEGIDKQVRPPMVASVAMKNEPASTLPGGVTYVTDVKDGFKPAYQVLPQLADMKEDIIEVQNRIKSVFFVDLFMMISQLETVRTATEIDARREEKLILLGPVIERFENEVLDPIIDRVFAIMARKGLIPPAPQAIVGQPLNIQYVSMLAEAQRAASTASIERLLALAGNLAGVQPDVMDNIDVDKAIDLYADALSVSPEVIRASAQVIQLRQDRAQQQNQQAAAQGAMGAAQAAANLAKVDVGGGQNALSMIMGGGGAGGGMPGQQQTFGPQARAA